MSDSSIKIEIGLSGILLLSALSLDSIETAMEGHNDFIPFYVAAGLAGSSEIWEPWRYYEFMDRQFGEGGEALVWVRLPFYALALKPLSWLDHEAAYAAWWVLRLGALAGFLALRRASPRAERRCS